MAAVAGYSNFHFTRIFTSLKGLPPIRYLIATRIQQAMRLLETTDLPVTTIAGDVGYTSIGAFGNRFAEEVGFSPNFYRFCAHAARAAAPDVVTVAMKRHAATVAAQKTKVKPGEYLLLNVIRQNGCITVGADGYTRLGNRQCDVPLTRLASPELELVELDADGAHWRLTPAGALAAASICGTAPGAGN
jgi:AraC-like DNA-binding protein